MQQQSTELRVCTGNIHPGDLIVELLAVYALMIMRNSRRQRAHNVRGAGLAVLDHVVGDNFRHAAHL